MDASTLYFVTPSIFSLYSCCSYKNATTFDASTSGIHFNTIMYEEYGKFVYKCFAKRVSHEHVEEYRRQELLLVQKTQ
jgi:hypothetical protein